MDDDLMSLRGSMGSDDGGLFGGSDDSDDSDDLFGGFDDPTSADFDAPSTTLPPTSSDTVPDWLGQLRPAEMDDDARPAPAAVAAPARREKEVKPKRERKQSSASGTGLGGLTPQQWMFVSIFLFLDVTLLGCAALWVLNVISF